MLSLWLMPDKETYSKLSQLIEDLSTVHHTPSFEPHVTLLSGIIDPEDVALEKVKQLAQNTPLLSGSLTRIEYLEYYYRCLFFRTDDCEDIFDLRKTAEALFEHTNVNPFIPHVSFLYGALPVFKKEAIVAELGDRFFMQFNMQSLRLIKTELTPEHWELMGEFELGSSNEH